MPAESNSARVVGWCALAIILSLYIVGMVSHGVIRHIVQTAPIWVAVWLGMKRSQWAKWAAFPSFVFWLAIAVMIWLFLLGWARMVSGTFSPIEIAMTIAFAAASVIGMWKSVRSRTQVSWAAGIGVFVLFAFLQGLAFRISMLPRVAHDPW
jgi:hypothetical protein